MFQCFLTFLKFLKLVTFYYHFEDIYDLLKWILEEEAIERGEMARHVCNKSKGFFRVLIPNTPDENAEFVTFSFHSYYCHNTDAEDISRQILEQHQL